jgi:hypothetical protein
MLMSVHIVRIAGHLSNVPPVLSANESAFVNFTVSW